MTPATNDKSVGLCMCSLTHSARKPKGGMTHIRGIWYVTPRRLCDKFPGSVEKRKLESKLDMAEQENSKKKDIPLGDNASFSCESDNSLWFIHCPHSACYIAKKQRKQWLRLPNSPDTPFYGTHIFYTRFVFISCDTRSTLIACETPNIRHDNTFAIYTGSVDAQMFDHRWSQYDSSLWLWPNRVCKELCAILPVLWCWSLRLQRTHVQINPSWRHVISWWVS